MDSLLAAFRDWAAFERVAFERSATEMIASMGWWSAASALAVISFLWAHRQQPFKAILAAIRKRDAFTIPMLFFALVALNAVFRVPFLMYQEVAAVEPTPMRFFVDGGPNEVQCYRVVGKTTALVFAPDIRLTFDQPIGQFLWRGHEMGDYYGDASIAPDEMTVRIKMAIHWPTDQRQILEVCPRTRPSALKLVGVTYKEG